jgi:hypothetical protein
MLYAHSGKTNIHVEHYFLWDSGMRVGVERVARFRMGPFRLLNDGVGTKETPITAEALGIVTKQESVTNTALTVLNFFF